MKGQMRFALAALLVAVAAMGVLAGCEILGLTVTFDWSANLPYARVTDESGNGVAGVTVTLSQSGTVKFTATTDSTGKATFSAFTSAGVGAYELDASLTGYVFYPMDVTVGTTSVYVGTLIAYVPTVTTATVAGTVTDARLTTAPEIGGVTVKLFASGSTTELGSMTTGADGAFTFTEVDPGAYKLTASKTGYAFIDKTVEIAQIGATVNVGTILGFTSAANDIAIIAVWSATFSDVDSYITFPSADQWTTNPSLTALDPYSGADAVTGELTGFFPGASGTSGREKVYYSNKESTATHNTFYQDADTTPAIKLDRDDTSYSGPETITIIAPPVPAVTLSTNTVGDASNGLPHASTTSDDYSWIGVIEYYVDAFSPSSLSTEGQSGGAEVKVFVVQGSTVKGRFVVPDYIAIGTASVMRINMFVAEDGATPVYQFLPDIRIADYSGIRSVVGEAPLVLFGEPR